MYALYFRRCFYQPPTLTPASFHSSIIHIHGNNSATTAAAEAAISWPTTYVPREAPMLGRSGSGSCFAANKTASYVLYAPPTESLLCSARFARHDSPVHHVARMKEKQDRCEPFPPTPPRAIISRSRCFCCCRLSSVAAHRTT